MRTGVWLVGARGSVGVTAIVGLSALRAGLAETIGCVTELPHFREAGIPPLDALVVGGHDIVDTPLQKRAEELGAAGVVPADLVSAMSAEIAEVETDIRPLPGGATQADIAEAVMADLTEFRNRRALDELVVVNVASTEPQAPGDPAHDDLDTLRAALRQSGEVLPPSSLIAYAAFEAGCSFVDFTPSTGARLPALDSLARERRVPYAGSDGKTGETLVRSALAPMFAQRNLRVNSWSGTNLLGGGDGARLAEPGANAAKTQSKSKVLESVLGYRPQGVTRIDFVEELGDFKTAWDLISFSGFLGTRMRMELTWHGCDSALAAPLVLDLARLTAAAQHAGRVGPLGELGFFFKDPVGTAEASLADQWAGLIEFATGLAPA
ncbi:inositol-3-phosphate synthase [Paractinoplanes ferrugineus]|uniref:Myo-inositol-1-phosphate synthase n=1 Tax=Paractinoplanes ferrugineus TaxID=113564 RepID=A0A919MI25_9ACTN|nr:inositol-3-phosphate synthase [Actinoplanes ferrugineus]GIE13245.1 myo-inositol-1-phosphate synthase [Actinoplanes ferrugineus]